MPGGLADYLSEFVVQFYYVPLYGSMLTALVLTITQAALGLAFRRSALQETAYVLSAIPSVIYLGAMADENILLSFAVAMMLTSLFILILSLSETKSATVDTIALIAGFALLYWLAGPFAFIFIAAGGIMRRRLISAVIAFATAFAIVWAIDRLWLAQYPLSRLLLGINYYRVPEIYPLPFYVIAAAYIIAAATVILPPSVSRFPKAIATAAVIVFAVMYVPLCYNSEKGRVLAYDSLVRQGRWNDIIAKAEKERPSDIFSLQALNLALGMTGQLTENMFRFNQQGVEGLIGKNRLDNTTQLITAEALYRLGLTNIAFSTTFDLQEAIMNDRKSGRMMKRMAECMLINGNYKVAAKYIAMLRPTLFYSDWAKQAESLLNNDRAVETHPVYGPMRRNAFRKVAFYDHTQLDKILAMHAVDSEGANTLAWQYFCAAAMLKGELATLTGIYNYSSRQFSAGPIPRHVQEALAMYWTFSHSSFDSVPFPISGEVQRLTADLAQAVMRNQNNPSAWQAAAPGSFGVYFLTNARRQQASEQTQQYQHTHE